jgi:uncharacterized protein
MKFNEKVSFLTRRLRELSSAVVAFSGGVDSAVLTFLAHRELKDKMCAATAVSPSTPSRDISTARKFCEDHGIDHVICYTSEFDNPKYTSNPKNRCYFCKTSLYESLKQTASQKGFRYIVEGTNLSDMEGHRPGYKAACENSEVVTPLIDCCFSKDDVRKLARDLKLSVADKPSSACLSSRIPFGVIITPEALKQIDESEEAIRALGIKQVRVRHHGDTARIEVEPSEMDKCLKFRNEISSSLKGLGYKYVTVDLSGYKILQKPE